jgi:sirohydrochlorin cobaltochelatase
MKRAVLVVSFGTSYNESRIKTIEAIEQAIKAEFTDYELRRAFTSRIIIGILRNRDGIEIDGVSEALVRLAEDGYTHILVQPTLVMGGEENDRMLDAVEQHRNRFERIVCGNPLLTEEADYETLTEVLIKDTKEYDEEGTEIIFMGHGTEHEANEIYRRLAGVFSQKGYKRYHIGTVEADPSFEEVREEVKKTNSKRMVLQPLMIVSGDHAHNDMAGEEEDSWKSQLEAEGYQVVCHLKGMGELKGVRQMLVDHAKAAESEMEEKE